ncbi:hypothetical protein [Picrophilus oshimae]|uniref:Uncharacterized protein n=1 Tax=Picrophilus torridus (strain ATCC 700027 / DSM 9790 / JCM 10055 / NBRC 100828 / KAW 2/3) TaxID=1122961 RepID=A0A8G2FXY3_PICTO|nr:hypothetical protein [Picrophilus oshimae]SMD31478.1 hypothetical protein SAMN02745355_1421 [Picrophilus oshimae DSM 9789]
MAFFVVSNSMNNISVSSVSPNVYMESGSNYNSGGPGGVPETEFYISGINSPGEQMSTGLNIFFNYSAPAGGPGGPGGPGPGPGPGPAPKTTANNVIMIHNIYFSKNVEVCFLFNEPAYLSICYTVNEIGHPSGGPGAPPPSTLKSGTLYNITGEYMCLSMSLSSSNEDTFPFAFIVYYNDNTAIEYRFNINLNE